MITYIKLSLKERFSVEENITPMIAQYNMIKNQYKDYLLLYRLGDFYEMFYEDALVGSRELNIVLTRKKIAKNKDIPMCGIPYHSADSYITRLVSKGYSVAICEQLEDASTAKGIVKRDVIRVITPGTYFDNEKLKTGLVCVYARGKRYSGSYLNLSTGEFYCGSFEEESLVNFITKFSPREILLEGGSQLDFLDKQFKGVFKTSVSKEFFQDETIEELLRHFKVVDYRAFGLHDRDSFCLISAGALLRYVKETQKSFLPFISPPKLYTEESFMKLDQNAIKHLEVVSSEGGVSLLSVIDKTLTPMGRRRLKFLVLHPLKNVSQIKSRQESVEELFKNHSLREEIRDILKGVFDIERLISKITSNTLTPRDMVSLRESLRKVSQLKGLQDKVSSELLKDIFQAIVDFSELVETLDRYLEDNPPIHFKEGGLIKKGVNSYLDELRDIKINAEVWLNRYQQQQREKTGIPSLKVGYNRVMGYYIEITKPNLKYVPPDYKRRQTLSNGERFTTNELQEFEDKILSAEEKIKNLEYEIFLGVKQKVVEMSEQIEETARMIGMLDAIQSLAVVALERGWIKPKITEDYSIEIVEGMHPVVSTIYPDFVPNSLKFDKDRFIHLITGPNMSGKSTFIRQVGLLVLLSQIGSFIPAKQATIGIVDAIYTRIGSADYLSKGLSTFMVEMLEVANIINNATDKSLVILDEVGRGTSTYDGISIAWALCEKIAKDIKAKTLFSTHYHELTSLESDVEGVRNYTMAVVEEQNGIRFLYRVLEGKADRSYGVHVAKLAGIPEDVIIRAEEILTRLEKDEEKKLLDSYTILENLISQDKNENIEIIKRLEEIDIANITPLQALNILNELKSSIKYKKSLDI